MTKNDNRLHELETCCSRGFGLIKVKNKIPLEQGWPEKFRYDLTPDDFRDVDPGVVCTKLKDGSNLVVVDVDERNGGFESAEKMRYTLDIDLRDTFTVKTGNGYHYYYRTNLDLKKTTSSDYKGIDFIAAGGYVVGPGAIHPNGSVYEVYSDDPIAELPAEIVEIMQKPKPKAEGFFESDYKAQIAQGGRNNYLASRAGQMRQYGFDEDAIYAALSVENQKKCDPPLSDNEVKRIARSMSRYQPSVTIEPTQAKASVVKPEYRDWFESSIDYQKKFDESFNSRRGMLAEIAHNILNNADVKYTQFALAVAETLIGAIAATSYRTPRIDQGHGTSTTMYTWCLGRASAGKQSYEKAATAYLRGSVPRLEMPLPKNGPALMQTIYLSNVRLGIYDEFHDFMQKVAAPRADAMQKEIETHFKKLFNDNDCMAAETLKNKQYPPTELPRLSILGFGTDKGFDKLLNHDSLESGLISRFSIVPIDEIPEQERWGMRVEPTKKELNFLKSLAQPGLTDRGSQHDVNTLLKEWSDYFEQKNSSTLSTSPIYQAGKFETRFDPQAQVKALEYARMVSRRFRAMDKDPDYKPVGSICSRSLIFALKRATIEALGRESSIVDSVDVQNAIEFTESLVHFLVSKAISEVSDDKLIKVAERVKKLLAEKRHKKSDLLRRLGNGVKAKELNEVLKDLIERELVVIVDHNGTQFSIDGKFPRDCFFASP